MKLSYIQAFLRNTAVLTVHIECEGMTVRKCKGNVYYVYYLSII